MTRWRLILLCMVMGVGQVSAQSPPPPDMPRDMALHRDEADRMTLPVYIGGRGPFAFLIDTGAQRTLLSRELAEALSLPAGDDVRIISLSGPALLPTAVIPHLRYGREDVRNLVAPLISRTNLGGSGILGLDGLKGKRLVLDFATDRMDIQDSALPVRREEEGDGGIVVRARNHMGQLILVNCRVGGQGAKVILDTGIDYSIGNMALLAKLRADRMTLGPRPVTLVSVVGEEIHAQLAVVRSISVGGMVIQQVPVIFTDAPPFDQLNLSDKPAMLLGMQILRLFHRITIDFAHRRIDFLPLKVGAEQGGP